MPEGGEVKLPVIGKVNKKYAIIGVGAAGAIVVVVMIRKKNAAAATPASGVDPTIDPATNLPYAEEQSSAEAQLASMGSSAADYGGGVGNLNTPQYDAAGYPVGSSADLTWQNQQSGVTTAITSNSQWLSAAEGILGDTPAVTQALTKVLGGVSVTSAQRDVFLEAVGATGMQPPGGYPQPIKLLDTPATPGTSTAKTHPKSSYTVKKGETLESVAAKFGITRTVLAHANGLGTGAGLRDGQHLTIPAH